MRKKTKNELKADAIHAFFKDKHPNMHRDNKYGAVEWFIDTYNRNVAELNRMSKVSSVISDDGLQSLFTMYDIIDNDLANEPTTDKLNQLRRLELMSEFSSFIMFTMKSFAGVSRVMRASEPVGMFVLFMLHQHNDNGTNRFIKTDVDALEAHIGDTPNMKYVSFLIRGFLTMDTSYYWRTVYASKLWTVRSYDTEYDDNGNIIRVGLYRPFNSRIFIDLCYTDIDAILAKYPQFFSNVSKFFYDDAKVKKNKSDLHIDESKVNDTNSIIWSRAISLDDLLACMSDVNHGIDEDSLLVNENLLVNTSLSFHRITSIMRTDLDTSDADYDNVINAINTISEDNPEGVVHFSLNELEMLLYASIIFDKKSEASIYAALIAFICKYMNDNNGARNISANRITLKDGNMNAMFLQAVHDMPYEFVKESFTGIQQSLNVVSKVDD